MDRPRPSRLGLGCASYWARPAFPEAAARAVLESALRAGVTLFDTGASYADGLAEQRLGRLLRELAVEPHELVISTKIGTVRDRRGRLVKDFSPQRVIPDLAASLKRLGMERVSAVLLHGPTPADLTDALRRELERACTLGMTAAVGVNADCHTIRKLVGDPLFGVLMPFLSVREPDCRETIAAATDQTVIAAGPLARMSFGPPWRDWIARASGRWYLARMLARSPRSLLGNRELRRALQYPGWKPAELALAWVLDQPGVDAAVIGSTQPAHVRQLTQAAERPLPAAARERLNALTKAPPR